MAIMSRESAWCFWAPAVPEVKAMMHTSPRRFDAAMLRV
jgi:hypothetical protein